MTVVIQAKVVRATEKVDPLTGIGKSKGYGFLEMRSHQDALRVLRWANNNPTVEGLMRDWWTVELTELIERTRASVDEGRLEEIKRAGGLGEGAVVEEEKIEVLSKKAKAKAKAKAEAEEDGEEGPKKKEKAELSELESRLKRLTDKEKELKELIEAGREVVMKKTLIVEFSIENVQVRSFSLLSFRRVFSFPSRSQLELTFLSFLLHPSGRPTSSRQGLNSLRQANSRRRRWTSRIGTQEASTIPWRKERSRTSTRSRSDG